MGIWTTRVPGARVAAMRSTSLTVLGLLGCLLAAAGGSEDRIDWVGDYDEARRLARASGRPILVEFR